VDLLEYARKHQGSQRRHVRMPMRVTAAALVLGATAFTGGAALHFADRSVDILGDFASAAITRALPGHTLHADYADAPDFSGPEYAEFDWATYIANTGGQDAVDECAGGLTDMSEVAHLRTNQAYYPIHNQCGGDPILDLELDDEVFIAERGKFTVVDTRDVERGDTTAALAGLPGSILVQTCYDTGTLMRVVALRAS